MKKHMEGLLKLSSKELASRASELTKEISDLRRGIMTGEVENHQLAKIKRRELARVSTLLNRPVAEQPAEEKPAKAKKEEKK